MNKHKRLTGLEAKHFMHPGDRIGIERIRQSSEFKKRLEKLLEDDREDMYLNSLTDKVRLGPNQGKKLNDMLIEACEILDIKNPPILFMETNPIPNSYGYGKDKSIVVLTSGLVGMFSDEEILAVISHELGHIKCGHTFYTYITRKMNPLIQVLSMGSMKGAFLGTGLQSSLPSWYSRSELSADRAALLVTKSKDLIIKTMIKISEGGSESLTVEILLEQAEEYEKLKNERMKFGLYEKFENLMTPKKSSNLGLIERAREVIKFNNSDRYKMILENNFPEEDETPEGVYANDFMVKVQEKGKKLSDVHKKTIAQRNVIKGPDSGC